MTPTELATVAGVLALCVAVGLRAQPIQVPEVPRMPPRIQVGRLVDALRQVENGPAGNPWQMKPATWHQYTHVPMKDASQAEKRAVATEHVVWCLSVTKRLGLPYTVESTALVWISGFGNVDRGQETAHEKDYAKRVSQIYFSPAASTSRSSGSLGP